MALRAVKLQATSHPRTGVRRFLTWWTNELSDVAGRLTSQSHAWKIMFLRCESGCEVYVRARNRTDLVGTSSSGADAPVAELRRRLGRLKIAPREIVLRLQPSEVVQAHLSVPAAASEVLEPIIRNQLERLAPWSADKALFAYESRPAPDAPATLDIHLAVTGRSLVESLVAELDGIGLAPGIVDYGTDVSAEPHLNLLAAGIGANQRSGRLLLSWIALLCALSLVTGAFGIVGLVQRTRELSSLSETLQELRSRVAAELPSKAIMRRQARLAAEKLSQPSMAIMLEALSRSLPDDAWLNRLEVEQGTVRLAGNATNAAALIGQIEASGHFREV